MNATPKSARNYRRKPASGDRTRNVARYRVEGSWDSRPDRPAVTTTPDKRRAQRLAREWAATGAYVIFQENGGHQVWRTLYEIDGPARIAAQRAADRRAVAEARRAAVEAEERLRAADDADAEHDRYARLMTRPPVPRDATGRVTARHTAGA
ncbi:hypothetical protein [Streptomyces sp. NPDC003278]|uniref:hypothetical protein n=1 Tax=Streptomyces sp. NPDC003278 TaxID=3364679 RepID=UPI0036895807